MKTFRKTAVSPLAAAQLRCLWTVFLSCAMAALTACGGDGGSSVGHAPPTVTAPVLESLAISPNSVFTGVGLTKQLSATGTYSDGSTADVTTTASWTSSATSTMTVGPTTGLITGAALGSATVQVSLGSVTASASVSVVTDQWSPGGNLLQVRSGHTAIELADGKVLISGGWCLLGKTGSSELYNPLTGTSQLTGNMVQLDGCNVVSAVLPDKRVLTIGEVISNAEEYSSEAEIYDPASGTWSVAVSNLPYMQHMTATVLTNGKVLVAGGEDFGGSPISAAEIYDPVAGTWSPTGSMSTPRSDHTATLLQNGLVLVTGGIANIVERGSLASTEIYDPVAGTWSSANNLATPRYNHTATLLQSGQVLVAGGVNESCCQELNPPIAVVGTAEIFDPATGAWSSAGNLSAVRWLHTAASLADGKVMLVGGFSDLGNGPYGYTILASTDVYDPAAGIWSPGPSLALGRFGHSQTLLSSGVMMVAGGTYSTSNGFSTSPSVELFW